MESSGSQAPRPPPSASSETGGVVPGASKAAAEEDADVARDDAGIRGPAAPRGARRGEEGPPRKKSALVVAAVGGARPNDGIAFGRNDEQTDVASTVAALKQKECM